MAEGLSVIDPNRMTQPHKAMRWRSGAAPGGDQAFSAALAMSPVTMATDTLASVPSR